MEIATRILDLILPCRRRTRNLEWLVKTLIAENKELAVKHKNLRLAYHDLVGNASLDHNSIPFYEKRIATLKTEADKLRAQIEVEREAHAKAVIHVFSSFTKKD